MTSHRGLSAVVGTVFLVAVVIGALSYISYSMDVMGNFSQSLIVEESRQKDKQSEAFEISSIDITQSSKLDGVIKNTGEIPVKITTVYIDEQGVNDVVQKFDLDAEIAPGNTADLSSLVDFTMDVAKGYNMKVVSSRGEVNSFYVNSLADENVYMTLTANPSITPSTFTTTILFTIVNNMSNGNHLYNLTPEMDLTQQTIDESSSGLSTDLVSGPIPTSYDSLGPGEVAVFSWVYSMQSDTDDDTQIFNATLANANTGNYVETSASVKSVPLAAEAGSSLSALGITDVSSEDPDVLYLHQVNNLSPNGEYHMDGASPNAAGLVIGINEGVLEFISAPMTAVTTVPAGEFDVELTYFSNIVPIGFPEPDLAFFMDCKDCGDDEEIASSVNTFDTDKGFTGRWDGEPDFSGDGGALTPGDGPDGDEFYHFDSADDEYWWDDWGVEDNGASEDATQVGDYPDTTAFWVRIEPTTHNHDPIIVAEECCDTGHNDYYGFWIVDSGEIRYTWETAHAHHGSYPDKVECETPVESGTNILYDDDTWYHVVGVRDNKYSCKLYIDGVLMDSQNPGDLGDDYVGNENWSIGYGVKNGDGADFDGDVASFIHWNNDALTSDQVQDLYYTNYGNNATRVNYKMEVVDTTATTVISTIADVTKAELPFKDVALGNTLTQSNPWINIDTSNGTDGKFYGDASGDTTVYFSGNLTTTTISETSLAVGERLRLTLDWNGMDEQNLPINLLLDRQGWTYSDGPSYFHTPESDPPWPTFLSFDYLEELTFSAFNEGPEGIWFVFSGTRMVLTSNDGVSSYAAMPRYVNYTNAPSPANTHAVISPTHDSMYIPDQYTAVIDFYVIQAPPADDNSPCNECQVPSGDYDAALYLQGYTESGETFKKTVDLGLVHITGNP